MPFGNAVLLSWSGGKDAAWTLSVLRQQASYEVVGLFTTITRDYARASIQGIRQDVLHAQAEAIGLPLIEVHIPAQCSNVDYEATIEGALHRAKSRWPGLRTMAFGDLQLEDVRNYRVDQLARQEWEVLTPLFGTDTATLAQEMIDGGLRASVCCVDTTQLDASFSGRSFDHSFLSDLPPVIDPCGENGEFHTCAYAGPMFVRPIRLKRGESVLRDKRFNYTDFLV